MLASYLVSTLKDALLSIAFPQACHVCRGKVRRSADGIACSDCWSETEFISGERIKCIKCGDLGEGLFSTADCPTCREQLYDLARSVAVYEKAMTASVLHLKRVPVIPSRIIEALPLTLTTEDLAPAEVIVPVPLSKSRSAERGFNQAEVIAAAVAKVLRIPVDTVSLTRTKHTPMHRAAMDRKAREMTVTNAFKVVRPKLIEGRSILLVDDIFTSGATASYCAKALKKKGAADVKVFTLARARR